MQKAPITSVVTTSNRIAEVFLRRGYFENASTIVMWKFIVKNV